jgi:hypothetical protein
MSVFISCVTVRNRQKFIRFMSLTFSSICPKRTDDSKIHTNFHNVQKGIEL